MKPFGRNHIIISIITFAVLFLMNYIGNEAPDRLSRALLVAFCGVVGLGIGLFILYKNRGGKPYDDFD